MLDRLNVSVALATIVAVLGKLAVQYDPVSPWFGPDPAPGDNYFILLGVFLVFFRGKMMHDDSIYFAQLAVPGVFNPARWAVRVQRVGLIFGYVSWLLWAPAIFFADEPDVFAAFMLASIAVSAIWLFTDIVARATIDPKRLWWLALNLLYALPLTAIRWDVRADLCIAGLVVILLGDWLFTDPFGPHLSPREGACPVCGRDN